MKDMICEKYSQVPGRIQVVLAELRKENLLNIPRVVFSHVSETYEIGPWSILQDRGDWYILKWVGDTPVDEGQCLSFREAAMLVSQELSLEVQNTVLV